MLIFVCSILKVCKEFLPPNSLTLKTNYPNFKLSVFSYSPTIILSLKTIFSLKLKRLKCIKKPLVAKNQMNEKAQIKYMLPILGGVALVLVAGYAGYRLLSGGKTILNELPKTREIHSALEIGTDWIEITPQPPMKSSQQFQYVGLKLDSVKDWDKNDRKKLALADGSPVLIEIELSDEHGNKYLLVPNRIGNYIEFGKDKSNIPLSAVPTNEPDFPPDRVYPKLRIRSQLPIKCEQIIWGNYTSW
jgi:hypothetical protein